MSRKDANLATVGQPLQLWLPGSYFHFERATRKRIKKGRPGMDRPVSSQNSTPLFPENPGVFAGRRENLHRPQNVRISFKNYLFIDG